MPATKRKRRRKPLPDPATWPAPGKRRKAGKRRYPQAEPAMPGRPPDRLRIEGDWTEAVRKALKKGKPAQ